MRIDECIDDCRRSGATGWDLVEFAQCAVMEQMVYSYDNPLAMPKRAFEQGKGYCVQQAYCMREILRALGFDCELVYCTKVEVVGKVVGGEVLDPFFSGHTWNRVTIDGETRDVCTTSKGNRPGKAAFVPLAPVRRYGPLVAVFGYLGSIPACIRRGRRRS